MRALLLALAIALPGAAPAQATLFEISGRTDGAVPSTKQPRAATDVHLEAQILTALPDGALASVTGWIDSLVGIDANGIAKPLKGARHLLEDPADIAPAPGGGVLVSNEEMVQRIAPDGARTTVVARQCDGSVCATPWGLAPRGDGGLLVADTFNDRVRLVAPDGTTTTVVGTPVHWPFAVGLLPDGGFMVAEGKPGHGRIGVGLHVWRVAPDGTPTVVAGGGAARRPAACGGTAAAAGELELRHMVDATTAPDGTIYVADRTAGLFAIGPGGTLRVLACPPPALPTRIGDLLPAGLELGQVRMRVRHVTVAPDGTLYVVDGAGRVYADLAPGAHRLGVALAPQSLDVMDSRLLSVGLTRPAALAGATNGQVEKRFRLEGSAALLAGRLPAGVQRLRLTARAGAAVATHELRVLGGHRLPLRVGRRLLRRELRWASRFGVAPRLRDCRAAGRAVSCRRPRASIRRRSDGALEIRRGQRQWLAVP